MIVAKINEYKDGRGNIEELVDMPFQSVIRIFSKTGSIRANHWHKEDYHITLLLKGKVNYYERPLNSDEKPIKTLVNAGEMFYTRPLTEHCMEFVEDSEMLCFCKLSRKQEDYEKDTIRLKVGLETL